MMAMKTNKKFATINQYIESQPEHTGKALKELKSCILKAAPDAEELFNYDIPAFALVKGGKRDRQVMIAGYKKHAGFYPHPSVIEHFADKLKEYKSGKGSVQFPNEKPIPCGLIVSMVKFQMKMPDEK
jgi:uncharacterized protein YdhG (YjbR/CyaY superfamily)